MAEKNKTIYQALNSFLNFDSYGAPAKTEALPPQEKQLLKANSPQELKVKSLEIQQQEYLLRKTQKVQEHGFMKAMQYEAQRMPAFIDYEGMEYYPLISNALTLLAEEATTLNEHGRVLEVYSNKERIKNHIEDLLYGIMEINTSGYWIARNLCKYGDNFMHIYGEPGKGVTFVNQLINYDIERHEKFEEGKLNIKFKQKTGQQDFENLEIAHFRLINDDKYRPYGSSVLNQVRRTWRQLIMAEDAMLTYRILRAGEKRVFKIPVGNLDGDDVEAYMDRVIARAKKAQQVNPTTGQIDYRFNIMGNDEDIFIPVPNANVGTIIDTLPGAQNLDAIQDIEYLRDNLFMGLGVPRPFLSYQSAGGEGKNMAQFDVRFAKKIVRIQQAIIQELNKICIIHLYYLGFRGEDLRDFRLLMTNPSTQTEILKMEILEAKARVYKELTTSDNSSIAAFSHTWGMRYIFNRSDKEIIEDIRIQRIEKAISQELQDTALIIKNTGIFKDIDDRYQGGQSATELTGQPSPGSDGGDMGFGGGFGSDIDGGAMASGGGGDFGGSAGGGAAPTTNPQESINKKQKMLLEQKNQRLDSLLDKYESLLTGDKKVISEASREVSKTNADLNDKAFALIEALDKNPSLNESIELQGYEDSDEDYLNFIKIKEETLRDQLNSLNERQAKGKSTLN